MAFLMSKYLWLLCAFKCQCSEGHASRLRLSFVKVPGNVFLRLQRHFKAVYCCHTNTSVAINSALCLSRLKSDRTAPQVSQYVGFTKLNTKQTRLSALAFQHRPRNIVRSTLAKDAFIPNEECCHCTQFVRSNDVMHESFETVLLRGVLRCR